MVALISLSLIIPFLMILFAQKRNYKTELEQIASDYEEVLEDFKSGAKRAQTRESELRFENIDLKAKLEAQELKVMRSCRNWSKIPQLKCAVNPSGSCLECRDYEVLGK
jgi:hypothetical protein